LKDQSAAETVRPSKSSKSIGSFDPIESESEKCSRI
jgi:hypothetical protein